MLLDQHQVGGIRHRLYGIGLPTSLSQCLTNEITKWVGNSGIEWTIKRCKSLKVDLFRRKSGLAPLTWIRKNSSGDVGGSFGSLFRYSDKGPKQFFRTVQALNCYTYFTFDSLTENQKEKFLNAINAPEVDIPQDIIYIVKKSAQISIGTQLIDRSTPVRLITYRGSPTKLAPVPSSLKTIKQSKDPFLDLKLFNPPSGFTFFQDYRSLYTPVLQGLKLTIGPSWIAYVDPKMVGGEVHFLQEPGGKLRSVASPYRIHQMALNPLGKSLFNIVKQLPWDCTFDQSKAQPFIQDALLNEHVVHSIDLSSATDYFPLGLQLAALQQIFGNVLDISLFRDISRSTWKSSIGPLRWNKGQPLGLYPSFASFTLTHGLLLFGLNDYKFSNNFFVVGDDVIILNDTLYHKYIKTLEVLGCPYSLDKSLSSNKLSEFAGKIITSTEVFPQYKWRKMSDDNFLDLSKNLGKRSRTLLTRRQKFVFDTVKHLFEPLGLNMSYPGSNLADMYYRSISLLPEGRVLGSLVDLTKLIHTRLYESTCNEDSFPVQQEIESIITSFDEKVVETFRNTIFREMVEKWKHLSEMFSDLPEALGLRPMLPPKEYSGSRNTTLIRYERMIKGWITSPSSRRMLM